MPLRSAQTANAALGWDAYGESLSSPAMHGSTCQARDGLVYRGSRGSPYPGSRRLELRVRLELDRRRAKYRRLLGRGKRNGAPRGSDAACLSSNSASRIPYSVTSTSLSGTPLRGGRRSIRLGRHVVHVPVHEQTQQLSVRASRLKAMWDILAIVSSATFWFCSTTKGDDSETAGRSTSFLLLPQRRQ